MWTSESGLGGRIVSQQFIWYWYRAPLDFGAYPHTPQGYEADLYLSVNDGTYLDPNDTFSIPNVIEAYWSGGDCLYSYLDSRALDDSNSKAYTIGCADAYHLLTEKWYTTYIRTNPGSAITDRGFVSPQSQESTNGGECRTTWCFKPTATCLIGGPPGTYPIYVPASTYGQYHWVFGDRTPGYC